MPMALTSTMLKVSDGLDGPRELLSRRQRGWWGDLRATESSLEVTLPLMSQVSWGPVHWQSK